MNISGWEIEEADSLPEEKTLGTRGSLRAVLDAAFAVTEAPYLRIRHVQSSTAHHARKYTGYKMFQRGDSLYVKRPDDR